MCNINYEKICDDNILVDVDALVNKAYETIKGQAATDKFEAELNGQGGAMNAEEGMQYFQSLMGPSMQTGEPEGT